MIEWKMRMVANCMRRNRSLCACPKQIKEERTRGRQGQHKAHVTGSSGGDPGATDWSVRGNGKNTTKGRPGTELPGRNEAQH